MPEPSPSPAPVSRRDDEPADDSDKILTRFLSRDHAERDGILFEQTRQIARWLQRIEGLVSNSAEASAQMAREHREAHRRIEANVDMLVKGTQRLGQAIGDLSEGQGRIAAELAARAQQNSVHETEITAQRQAIAATAAEVRAVRLKAAALKAGLGASAIAIWEAAKALLPLLSP